jgi:hypothetical protein
MGTPTSLTLDYGIFLLEDEGVIQDSNNSMLTVVEAGHSPADYGVRSVTVVG